MSFLYSCASNNIRAHSKQRTPVGMKTLLCNELVYIEDFLKVEEIEARLLTALGTEQKKKKIIFFETCSTIWNIRYQDSVWLYTDPSIGQDMTNTLGLYYMQVMGSQRTSHLLHLGTQAHCTLTFILFPSPFLVFMKHKLYCISEKHGAPQAAFSQTSQECSTMQLLHCLFGHSLNMLLRVNKEDLS